MINTHWNVLITMPRAEKRVAQQLCHKHIENYLPIHKELKQWHDRKTWVEEVLFKRYLFVKTNKNSRNEVFNVPGIVKYLSIGQQMASVSDLEIERIKKLCRFNQITIDNNQIETGQEVEIISGELIGQRGRLISVINNHKIRMRINGLSLFATIEISKDNLRLIDTTD